MREIHPALVKKVVLATVLLVGSLCVKTQLSVNLRRFVDKNNRTLLYFLMENFMDHIFTSFNGDKWEKFCIQMLRAEYGFSSLTAVEARDRGDCGIECFTLDGTIFQCYFPSLDYSVADNKKHIQNKIRNDLSKLELYHDEIIELIDDLVIKRWILLIPEIKSKSIITYCNKYKNLTRSKGLSYLDNDNFIVKCETADSFIKGKISALKNTNDLIKIIKEDISENDITNLKESIFEKNINRKSKSIENVSGGFAISMLKKYITLNNFLTSLRSSYPDTYADVEECARILLNYAEDLIVIEGESASMDFIKKVKEKNEIEFNILLNDILHKLNLSDLPYGYISKWLAECNMDFIYD